MRKGELYATTTTTTTIAATTKALYTSCSSRLPHCRIDTTKMGRRNDDITSYEFVRIMGPSLFVLLLPSRGRIKEITFIIRDTYRTQRIRCTSGCAQCLLCD